MRAKYLQEACHYQCSFIEQIKKLNGKVLDFIVPNVISNVKQYVGYIKDISSHSKGIDLLMLIVEVIIQNFSLMLDLYVFAKK